MPSQDALALIAASELEHRNRNAQPKSVEVKSDESQGACQQKEQCKSAPKNAPSLTEFDHRGSGSLLNNAPLSLQLAKAKGIHSAKQCKYIKKVTLYTPGLFARDKGYYQRKLDMHIAKFQALDEAGKILEKKDEENTLSSIDDIKREFPQALEGFHCETGKLLNKVDEYLKSNRPSK